MSDEQPDASAIPPEYEEPLKKRGFPLERRLGGGAFGSVYRASQPTLGGRYVAVKFFDNKYMSSDENRARFEREAQLLARVEHRAIPYVLTTGIVDPDAAKQIPYTVMQFVRGETLYALAKKSGGKVDWKLAVEIICEVLAALAAAHKAEVIHRDVKPDNILHGAGTTYLIDFSIGLCREYAPGLTRRTRAGDKMGATDYASPEQLRDASSVDHRTDIYSTGVVLFELLAGHCRTSSTESLGDIPADLVAAIERATAHERTARFSTAVEFREALAALLTPNPVWLEPSMALCTNTLCEGAHWSGRGYFRGPRIIENTTQPHCERCGSLLAKRCSGCRTPFPANLAEMTTKFSKQDMADNTQAHCARCGTLIFRTPTCASCGSFLTRKWMKRDTEAEGCSKCAGRRKPRQPAPPPSSDDDIPF